MATNDEFATGMYDDRASAENAVSRLGALVGAGIPEHRAKKYQDRLDNGGILLGVKPKPEHREQIRDLFPADEEQAVRT